MGGTRRPRDVAKQRNRARRYWRRLLVRKAARGRKSSVAVQIGTRRGCRIPLSMQPPRVRNLGVYALRRVKREGVRRKFRELAKLCPGGIMAVPMSWPEVTPAMTGNRVVWVW